VSVNVLESESTTLVEPNLEVSGVRKKTSIISAVSINVEATSHTLFESFIENKEVREGPGLPDRVLTVNKNESLGGKDQVTLALEVSSSSYMDVEFDEVSSEDKFFVSVLDWHELGIHRSIKRK